MRTVSYRLADLSNVTISLGFVGENEHTRVQFDAKKIFEQYPDAIPALTVRPPNGDAYPAVITLDGDLVIWDVSDSDLAYQGMGEIQLVFTEGETVAKSYIARTRISRSIVPTGEVPTPVQNWIDQANEVLEEVDEAIPTGGTTGQVLAKKSDADRDTEWVDQTGGGGGTSNYNDLSNKPQIGGVTLSGNKTLHDLGAAAEEDIPVVHNVPAGGSDNQVLAKASGTDYDLKWVNQSGGGGGGAEIDDTAGEGDTDVVWSADKTWTENEALKEAIAEIEEELNPEEFVDMTPYSTIGSAMINENGCREGRSVSRIRRYKVLAGQKIKLYITKDYKYSATYQFQNDETIPYSNNTNIVGTTHTDAVNGVVIVPEGATWLMVSCDNDSQTLVVQLAISKVTIMDRNTDVLDAVYASSRYGVHGGGEENPNKMLSIVVSTDVHGWYERLNSAIEYMNAIPSIDGGCCLGDIVSGNFTEDTTGYNSAVAKADKPWFTVIGNHDCGNSTDPSLCGTTAQVVTKFITPNEEAAGQSGLSVPYYYYDWTDYNIRFIVMYNYDSPTDQSGGAYIIRRGGACYDQTQLDWLVTTLNSTPSGYGVVILRHGQPETNIADSGNFTQIGQTYTADNGTGCYGGDPIVSDIVNAWANGTTLSKSYTPENEYSELLDTITISADFTSRGEGEFICYLVGHMHKDIMCHDAVHTDQKIISLAATAEGLYQNANSDLPRITGRKSIDCITVVSFDTIGKRINLVRIGSNKTITMVDRTMISIPYDS